MNLRDKFLSELKAIIGQTNQLVNVTDGPRNVRAAIDQCEPLAVGVSEFVLETSELAGVDIAKLESASKSLCQRVNYLLEPISPIETDADGCVVQMRSNPPLVGDTGQFYYELLLRRGGSIELCRYENDLLRVQPSALQEGCFFTRNKYVAFRLVLGLSHTALSSSPLGSLREHLRQHRYDCVPGGTGQ